MKLFNPFRRPPQPRPYSLVDVGQDSVKAAVVLQPPNSAAPQLIGCGLTETDGHDITGGRREAAALTERVNLALTQAEDQTEAITGRKIVPDEVIFALPSRATIGQVFLVEQTRPRPREPISRRELSQLERQAIRTAHQNLAAMVADEGHWHPLTMTKIATHLDNRLVLDGVGLAGRNITLSLFGVAVQPRVLRALETLAERLNLQLLKTVAASEALTRLITYREALIIDLGFSGTSLYLIQDSTLMANSWSPLGGHFFSQALAETAQLKLSMATALKHELFQGDLTPKEAAWLNARLQGARHQWYKAIAELLVELSPDRPLPRQVYLTGGGSRLPGLATLLRANPQPFDCAPEVAILGERPLPMIKNLLGPFDYHRFAVTVGLALCM